MLLGGFFTTAGGQTHQGLAAVNATTGAIDHTFMNINVTERHNNSGSGALGSIGVKDMEATPDGSKLVAIGNFRKANGLDTGADPCRRPERLHQRWSPSNGEDEWR